MDCVFKNHANLNRQDGTEIPPTFCIAADKDFETFCDLVLVVTVSKKYFAIFMIIFTALPLENGFPNPCLRNAAMSGVNI